MNLNELNNIIKNNSSNFDSEKDKDFFKRIYSSSENYYKERINAVNFKNFFNVLDAGCGYGQWAMALADKNKNVLAADVSANRIKIAKIISKNNMLNDKITFFKMDLNNLSFRDNYFDAIFSYSVIYQTNYKKTLAEFYRVLKKEGKLYFTTNGVGWYIFNMLKSHNPSEDFSPRKYSIATILNTLQFKLTGKKVKKHDLFTNPGEIKKVLEKNGFHIEHIGPEGTYNKNVNSPYKYKYYGLPGVFEVMSYKK